MQYRENNCVGVASTILQWLCQPHTVHVIIIRVYISHTSPCVHSGGSLKATGKCIGLQGGNILCTDSMSLSQ